MDDTPIPMAISDPTTASALNDPPLGDFTSHTKMLYTAFRAKARELVSQAKEAGFSRLVEAIEILAPVTDFRMAQVDDRDAMYTVHSSLWDLGREIDASHGALRRVTPDDGEVNSDLADLQPEFEALSNLLTALRSAMEGDFEAHIRRS